MRLASAEIRAGGAAEQIPRLRGNRVEVRYSKRREPRDGSPSRGEQLWTKGNRAACISSTQCQRGHTNNENGLVNADRSQGKIRLWGFCCFFRIRHSGNC